VTRPVWTGRWAADELGIRVRDAGGAVAVEDLVGVGLRRNPRRAQLLVSGVLGKHVPAPVGVVREAGEALGDCVADVVTGSSALVIGFAETATALGHLVAERTGVPYLHTTRRRTAIRPTVEVDEEHSHASRHHLVPADASLLERGDVAVLVDDELSTARTAMNLIAALHRIRPRTAYVLAALVDARNAADRRELRRFAHRLGTRICVVSLARAAVRVPRGLPAHAARLGDVPLRAGSATDVTVASRAWPATVPVSGRHGFLPEHGVAARAAAAVCAEELLRVQLGPRVHVLGTEELMYVPLLIGEALEQRLGPTARVRVSATTRSPAVVLDVPGYPLRTGMAFASHDDPIDGPGVRYAYNVSADGGASDIVLVVDTDTDTDTTTDAHAVALRQAGGLLAAVAETGARVHLVALPGSGDGASASTAAPAEAHRSGTRQ
jgi:adenine/guanine phosphoribosyltransferase-like PRPP-binding protein